MVVEAPGRLQVLNRVSTALNGSVTSGEVIDNAVSTVLTATGLGCGTVYWLDTKNELLVGRAAQGFRYGLTPGIDVHSKRSHSLPSKAYRASEPLLFNVADRRSGYDVVTERERRCIVPEGIHAAVFIKIGSGKSPYGVLALCAHHPSWRFDDDWMELFSMVSEQVGVALDRAQSQEVAAQHATDLEILHEIAYRLEQAEIGTALPDALEFARRSFGFEQCAVDEAPVARTTGAHGRPSVVPTDIAAPLAVGNQGFGRLLVTCEDLPDAREQRLARAVADLAAVAMWRDWRYRESNRASLAELRSALAREVHDGIAQRFYVIQLNLTAASGGVDEPGEVRGFLDQALHNSQLGVEESRQWVYRLRQPQPRHRELRDELAAIMNDFVANFDVPCELNIFGNEVVLDVLTHQALASAVQELLHNVGRHADAASARMDAQFTTGRIEITITDDGRGIGSEVAEGFGLRGVRERMTEVGASLSVSGGPAGGTVATLSVPLSESSGARR